MIRSQREIAEARHPMEELSSSDRMLLRYSQSREWVAGNTRTLYFVLGAIVLVGLALYYYSTTRRAENERAAAALAQAVNIYNAGDYRAAIDGQGKTKGLRSIVNEYSSTETADHAALFLGNAYYYLGQYDSALAAFNDASISVPLIDASVIAGKAAVHESKGNKAEAAELFETAAKQDKNNPMNADYLLSAARDLREVGKTEDAVRIYRRLLEEYPGTQFDDAAKRALMQLNVSL